MKPEQTAFWQKVRDRWCGITTDTEPKKEISRYSSGAVRSEHWVLNYAFHREDGPAVASYAEDGKLRREHWRLHGKRHREDGPAYISYCKDGSVMIEEWYRDDKLHRTDGPAAIAYYDGEVRKEEWWIDGVKLEDL